MALSGRGLFVAGATLLLAVGGIALASAVGAASAPADPDLGPPVVVQLGTATSPAPGDGGPAGATHHAEDDEHGPGPTVVGPPPAHEVDGDDDAEDRATPPHG